MHLSQVRVAPTDRHTSTCWDDCEAAAALEPWDNNTPAVRCVGISISPCVLGLMLLLVLVAMLLAMLLLLLLLLGRLPLLVQLGLLLLLLLVVVWLLLLLRALLLGTCWPLHG